MWGGVGVSGQSQEAQVPPNNVLKLSGVSTLKILPIEADIQFVVSSVLGKDEIGVLVEGQGIEALTINQGGGLLSIQRSSKTRSNTSLKFRVFVTNTCRLDVAVIGKSHVFIPNMAAPLRLALEDLAQVTVGGCSGLVLHQKGFVKTQVDTVVGDMVVTQSDQCLLGIKSGEIPKALITATESSSVSIAAQIYNLRLETKGKSRIHLGSVKQSSMWAGRGNETIVIHNLQGVADVTANYASQLTVEKADLQTLLAATSSTGKIKISGTVRDAAFSAKGASEIVVDKITGKVIRKNQSNKGIIKILNP